MKAAFLHIVQTGIVVLVLGLAVGFAQTVPVVKPEAPPGPLLASAPDFSQWVITFSYPEDRAASMQDGKPPLPSAGLLSRTKTIFTTKTKDVIHEEYVDGNGARFDEWHVGPSLYLKDAQAKQWGEIGANTTGSGGRGGPGYSQLPANGFRDLEWIGRENYVGTMKLDNRPCLVFVDGAPPDFFLSSSAPASQTDQLDAFSRVAYIDAESRLPTRVQSAGVIRYYRFGQAPADMLTLPPDLAGQIKAGQQAQERLSQRLPRPY